MSLENKVDFAVIIRVKHANPNGDPLNGNRPRVDYNGYGEITDVCLKRKIRDRMLERYVSLVEKQRSGQAVFVQSDDRNIDGEPSLRKRAESKEHGLGKGAFEKNTNTNRDKTAKLASKKWIDVRAFGQVFPYAGESKGSGVSIAIRGPVTIQSAFSVQPIETSSNQIVKSVKSEEKDGKQAKMGMKHRVDSAVYLTYGAMNPQLAERTSFSQEDAQTIKEILPKLFENDASSARPEGSMEVLKIIWWEHNCKAGQYSSAKVHGSLTVEDDGEIKIEPLKGLKPEIIDGF